MNTGIQDAIVLGDALVEAITSGNDEPLHAYDAVRRPIAVQVVAFTDRLTRMATVGPGLRPLRNTLLRVLASVPAFRRRLAWQLSGLVYR
jgi:2-polyprenyl-6-methoxyphenol hydroxylase-like FAD-dependent oxidoreductase